MKEADAVQAAESLRRLLDLIESGEVAATADERHRLEGALAAFAAAGASPGG